MRPTCTEGRGDHRTAAPPPVVSAPTFGAAVNRLLKGVDPAVFLGSAALIAGFVGWGLFAPDSLGSVMGSTLGWVIRNFGWAFVLMAFGALALCIFLVVHPWGSIRLGPDDSRPSFSTFSWVSMMF